MSENRELQVQGKKELATTEESTIQARTYVPQADIFETENDLTVVLEMPGVAKEQVSVDLADNRLTIEGKIDFSKYMDLEPVYTEYNIGHYRRSFELSNQVDQDKISAEMNDGVLTLLLPKAETIKPRKIEISSG